MALGPGESSEAIAAAAFAIELDVPIQRRGFVVRFFGGIIRFIMHVLTEGGMAAGPTSIVRVRDRVTGRVVLEHDWHQSHDAALQDQAQIEDAAQRLNLDEFCSEYGIDRDAPR